MMLGNELGTFLRHADGLAPESSRGHVPACEAIVPAIYCTRCGIPRPMALGGREDVCPACLPLDPHAVVTCRWSLEQAAVGYFANEMY